MRLGPWEITRAAPPPGYPAGTVATRLDLAAPLAQGARPDPGPLPQNPDPAAADPIRWNFPLAINQQVTVRRGLTPFAQLRALADLHDVIRTCIEVRKDHVTGLTWDFGFRESKKGREPSKAEDGRVNALRTFFARPDKRRTLSAWIRMAVEEVLVTDALSIHKQRNRGDKLHALRIIDGTTILPLLDTSGDTPLPPAVAFRQVIDGQFIEGGDCTTEQLIYAPRTVRAHSPYGLSPTEAVLLTVQSALNRQMFNLSYYADGNVPEGLVSTPENWTPQQVREFQDYWDLLLSGSTSARRRLKFVAHGMAESVHQFKEPDFDTKFDEWLLKVVCASFGVPPTEIGFTSDVNKATADSQENITYRRSIKPLATHIKEILDDVIAIDLQQPDMEATFTGGESEDKLIEAEIDEMELRMGIASVDDIRLRKGRDQIGLGPMIWTNEGPVFVEQLIREKDYDPDTSAPHDATPPKDDLSDRNKPSAVGEDAEEATEKIIDAELKRWRVVATRCVKRGVPVRAFQSAVVPADLAAHVAATLDEHLASEPNVGGVAKAFAAVEKDRAADRMRRKGEARYRAFLKPYFRSLGAALGDHMQASIAEQ